MPPVPPPILAFKKCVMVVAHPDDETLFGAGIILQNPAADWTVICCSVPRIDPIRAMKFYDACEALGARGIVLPFGEGGPHLPLEQVELLNLDKYDVIVTHNARGEYGHRHHIDVHNEIVKRYASKPCFFFGSGTEGHGYFITLSDDELQRKRQALECYDHVLPYEGVNMSKHEALLKRYFEGDTEGLRNEFYIDGGF